MLMKGQWSDLMSEHDRMTVDLKRSIDMSEVRHNDLKAADEHLRLNRPRTLERLRFTFNSMLIVNRN